MLTASLGFALSFRALEQVKVDLDATIAQNAEFIAALENDQKHVYELRLRYDAELQKNERLLRDFESIRTASQAVLGDLAPRSSSLLADWLDQRLTQRIRSLDAENRGLTALVTNLSTSVAEISGQTPPADLTETPEWFRETTGQLTTSFRQQTQAMDGLYATLSDALSAQYNLIERTPLVDPELSGVAWNPRHGVGGLEEGSLEFAGFEEFEDQASRLLALSEELSRVNALLECTPLASPVDYYNKTSSFGNRKDPFTKKRAWHNGVDLGAWPGSKVRATAAGTVRHAGVKGGYGRLVVIDHGCGIQTLYAHLKSIAVKKGDLVSHRDVIGAVGNTGRPTGPHVHYEIRIHDKAVDPYEFIEAGRYVFKAKEQSIASNQ